MILRIAPESIFAFATDVMQDAFYKGTCSATTEVLVMNISNYCMQDITPAAWYTT